MSGALPPHRRIGHADLWLHSAVDRRYRWHRPRHREGPCRLEPLATECGGRALAVDLAIPDEVKRLVREAGEIDILVANAALPASGALDSFSVQEIDRALDVNMRAPMVLAHELAPAMVAKGRGHLLFMSSLLVPDSPATVCRLWLATEHSVTQ